MCFLSPFLACQPDDFFTLTNVPFQLRELNSRVSTEYILAVIETH